MTADLFGWTPEPPETPELRREFEAFHAANPQIFRLFEHHARLLILQGHTQLSARDLLHRVRHEAGIAINNNWSPFYARIFHEKHPTHGRLFEIRRAIADEKAGRAQGN